VKTKYILVTAVHNEEELIEGTIKSVIAQTIRPRKWIIVDDDSTDGTIGIVKRYEAQYDFIMSLRLKRGHVESYYGHKVVVFRTGYEKVKSLEYDFLGALDADITFEPTYYEKLLTEFDRNSKLGIAAGAYLYEVDGHRQKVLIDELCTPGSNHVFRRECYEQIGGYISLKYGGEDSLADVLARMHGWETRNFENCRVIQHRIVGMRDGKSILQARFRQGLTEYGIVTHPLFMLAKSLRRAFLEKPYLIGSLARLAGFLYGYWLREERDVPSEAAHFIRKEQIRRLFSYISRTRPS
jgi:glycosyltransferase involved in cell wall biosynthesis